MDHVTYEILKTEPEHWLHSLTLASSASLFSSSTSSVLLLSSATCFFFFFCLGAMNPCRNFLITQAWMVMMHSPNSFKLSFSFNCVEGMKQTNGYELKLQCFMCNADTHKPSNKWQILSAISRNNDGQKFRFKSPIFFTEKTILHNLNNTSF